MTSPIDISKYFTHLKKINTNTIHFEIHHLHLSMVNAFRRVILSEIPTVGFRTEPYTESTVKIITNTSSLHNEFLAHRIGMIPIGYQNVNEYDETEYKYILKIKNTSKVIINVSSKDIQVLRLDKTTGEYTLLNSKERDSFFPPDPITKDYILINRLKPDVTDEDNGEEIHIEATAVVSNGKENARWSPVCLSTFHNKIDNEKKTVLFNKIKDEFKKNNEGSISKEDEQALQHRFDIFEADRIFHTNKHNEPNNFVFKVESIGILKPKNIILKAIRLIEDKINTFLLNLKKDNSDIISVYPSNTSQEAVDISIKNEDHTLGNIIQSHFNYYDDSIDEYFFPHRENINFVGYYEPHPLDHQIVVRIGLTKSYENKRRKEVSEYNRIEEVKNIVSLCMNKVIRLCKTLYADFEKL